jgi:O-succinylbenzoic acid--CoA ligase
LLEEVVSQGVLSGGDSEASARHALARRFCLDDDHTLIYTSGTTGQAKAVRLTYQNHWSSAMGSLINLGLTADDRWLLTLPIFHVSGLSILFRSTIYGMTVVLRHPFDAVKINQDIAQHRVTMISLVAVMLQQLLDAPNASALSVLRVILAGGGPTPLPLLERAMALGLPIYQSYGLTETGSQIVTLSPDDRQRKPGSSGKPLFGAAVEIREGPRTLPAGTVGEIVLRGPMVSPGYLGVSMQSEGDGRWLYTGDIGHLDDEGFLYVHDRLHDLIISGGENIFPSEVEEQLRYHPAVLDAGVVGAHDATWGQVPVAFLVLRPGAEAAEAEIAEFLRTRLAAYKVPRRIYWTEALPRNAAGKLLRRDLLDWANASRGGA